MHSNPPRAAVESAALPLAHRDLNDQAMRARLAALRDTLFVLAFQLAFRVVILLRCCNY